MTKLPADATKTALAEAAALRAVVFARKHRDGLVNRLTVEEAMSSLFNSPRYRTVPWPSTRTVFAKVRKLAAAGSVTVRLAVTDPENKI